MKASSSINIALPFPTAGGIGKSSDNNSEKLSSLIISFLLFSTILLLLFTNFFSSSWDLRFVHGTLSASDTVRRQCNMFTGNWVPEEDGRYSPYYTNATNCVIDDRQNCLKFGRPDTEFLKWRWKPDGCELPRFDGAQFLELVKGKSMAFVGDSLSRNQIESLVCMLASVAEPLNVSNILEKRMTRWEFAEQNFTLVAFWSIHLVRSEDAGHKFASPSTMNVYLDEVDEFWANHIENFDYVIISAAQWFLRPLMYYEKGKLVGCYLCNEKNVTDLTKDYGIKMAFRTSFKTLVNLTRFNGITFLRTFTPQHYENGDWNGGGNCLRRRPFFSKEEADIGEYFSKLYLNQVEELRSAEIEGKEKGLKFRVLDVTEMMSMRPDGHPNHYRRPPDPNSTIADCVHWCLPGPVDTLNELLLYMMKMEEA